MGCEDPEETGLEAGGERVRDEGLLTAPARRALPEPRVLPISEDWSGHFPLGTLQTHLWSPEKSNWTQMWDPFPPLRSRVFSCPKGKGCVLCDRLFLLGKAGRGGLPLAAHPLGT